MTANRAEFEEIEQFDKAPKVVFEGMERFNRVPKWVNFIFSILFIFLGFICLLPVVLVFMISISSEQSIVQNGYSFWPTEFSLEAYKYLWDSRESIAGAFMISLVVTVFGTIAGLLLNTSIAYALSRRNYKFRGILTYIIFIPMLFNGGMISFYIVVATMLQLKDTLWALILPMAASSFYIIILRTFFTSTIPDSLIESAKMDGASQFKIFGKIVLPISLPAIATVGLFLTFAYWNDWYNALLFIDSKELVPLQAMLNRIEGDILFLNQNLNMLGAAAAEVIQNLPSEGVRMAIVVIVVLPIACSYPYFQKYFISGLTIGAVKE